MLVLVTFSRRPVPNDSHVYFACLRTSATFEARRHAQTIHEVPLFITADGQGNADQFTKSENGDMERPYDLMSLMHYETQTFLEVGGREAGGLRRPCLVLPHLAVWVFVAGLPRWFRWLPSRSDIGAGQPHLFVVRDPNGMHRSDPQNKPQLVYEPFHLYLQCIDMLRATSREGGHEQ